MIEEMLMLAKQAVRIGMTGQGWRAMTAKCMAAAIIKDDPTVSFTEVSSRIFGNSYDLGRATDIRESEMQVLFEMIPGSIEAYEEIDRILKARRNKEA